MKASFLYLHHLILFNFIKVKAQHFHTFSKSNSVICFRIGQIKQAFSVFRTCKRYACHLFWDSKKIHSRKHKTDRVTHKYWLDRKEKLRKTGKEWKKLVTTSKKLWRQERVGNVTLVHFFLEPATLLWGINALKYLHLWTNQISVGHINNRDTCKPCTNWCARITSLTLI